MPGTRIVVSSLYKGILIALWHQMILAQLACHCVMEQTKSWPSHMLVPASWVEMACTNSF